MQHDPNPQFLLSELHPQSLVPTFRLLLLFIALTAQPILDLTSSHHHAQYLGRPIY
jgi:hypothetical protein